MVVSIWILFHLLALPLMCTTENICLTSLSEFNYATPQTPDLLQFLELHCYCKDPSMQCELKHHKIVLFTRVESDFAEVLLIVDLDQVTMNHNDYFAVGYADLSPFVSISWDDIEVSFPSKN